MTNTITLPRSVVEQALEALDALTDRVDGTGFANTDEFDRALDSISALRAALEQPQVKQEPVAWMYDATFMDGTPLTDWLTSKDPREVCLHEEDARNVRPLYLSQQPPRQPLTDEQIADIEDMFSNEFGLEAKHAVDFARAIERAHGIGGKV